MSDIFYTVQNAIFTKYDGNPEGRCGLGVTTSRAVIFKSKSLYTINVLIYEERKKREMCPR